MDNFKIMYRILKTLESQMDFAEVDPTAISHEQLRISYERWEQLIILMYQNGFITGVLCEQTLSDSKPHLSQPTMPRVTLRGLEYLAENSLMKKAEALARGIADLIP